MKRLLIYCFFAFLTVINVLNLAVADRERLNRFATFITSGFQFDQNNTYLQILDQSGNYHDVLKVDAGGNTVLNAPTGEFTQLAYNGAIYWQVGSTGISSPGASSLGWTVQTGTNTACTTTCTNAAVFGVDSGGTGLIVGPGDATAEECLCAGSS